MQSMYNLLNRINRLTEEIERLQQERQAFFWLGVTGWLTLGGVMIAYIRGVL